MTAKDLEQERVYSPFAGRNYPDGLVRVTWDAAWPESGNGPSERICDPDYHTAGRFTAYKSPYPLTEQDFLVSARPEGDRWKIYLMDTSGNRELIHEGVHNAWYPIPLRPRKKPPVIPQRPAWPVAGEPRSDTGMFFSSDVREGTPGVPPESVRYLRVIRSDYKTGDDLSAETLRMYEQTDTIRHTYFSESDQPQWRFALTPVSMSASSTRTSLTIAGP